MKWNQRGFLPEGNFSLIPCQLILTWKCSDDVWIISIHLNITMNLRENIPIKMREQSHNQSLGSQ